MQICEELEAINLIGGHIRRYYKANCHNKAL